MFITAFRILIAGFLLTAAFSLSAADEPEFDEIGREAARMLADIIRLNTTNPPGNETLVADYIAQVFDREGIRYQRLARDKERDNIIAWYHGSGRGRPILLYSHSDVVPATSEWGVWSVPPFSGVVDDGKLYGRGAIDAKGLLVAHLATMLLLKRNNVALDRDVVFMAVAAEETGGGPGMIWLLEEHPEMFDDIEVALGEGGRVWMRGDSVWSVQIQAAEKSAHNLTVTALGETGHASVPSDKNAIMILNRALHIVSTFPFEKKPNTVTDEFFRRITPHDSRAERRFPRYEAMTHNTVTATLIEGGVKTNVIPAFAEANLNLRILPGENLDEVTSMLEEAVGDKRVTIRHKPGVKNGATIDPFDTPFFETIEAAALEMWPTAVVAPYQSTGTSDASKLRRAGILTYGLMPFPLTEEQSGRVHGPDEHLELANLTEGIRFTCRIIQKWAAADVEPVNND